MKASKPLCDEHGGVFTGKRAAKMCSVPGCNYRSAFVGTAAAVERATKLRARAAEGSTVAFRELEQLKLAAGAEREPAAPSYPEHEKLRAVADQSQACGEFFEWLTERYTLAQWAGEKTLYPASVNIRKLLAEFFQIDEERLEDEKLAMLAALRKETP